METFFDKLLNFLSVEFTVILTAAIPVVELRGAIPVGISLGLSPFHATLLGLLGSMFPVPLILFSVRPFFNYLKTTRLFRKAVQRLSERSLEKTEASLRKYGVWGLIIFVAIPLPGTGVWTGSIAAALLDIRFKRAFPAILLGNIIAALIISGMGSALMQ
jgi:uncharacterized membrane protein